MEINLILVTCPDFETASGISEALIEQKLAGCVNIIPGLTSIYRWENKVERSQEVLMLIKTKAELRSELKEKLLKIHPYDTPEFIVVDSLHVEQKYKDWLIEACI